MIDGGFYVLFNNQLDGNVIYEGYFDAEIEAYSKFLYFSNRAVSGQEVFLAEKGSYTFQGELEDDWITYDWSETADHEMNGRPDGRGKGWTWSEGKVTRMHHVTYVPKSP